MMDINFQEGSDAVSVALGVAAATGLSLLAYTEVGLMYLLLSSVSFRSLQE